MTPEQKNKLIDVTAKDVRLFSNAGKKEREMWVAKCWMAATGRVGNVTRGPDPPDFSVSGEAVEIVEVVAPNCRRHDECKQWHDEAKLGEQPKPVPGEFLDTVKERGACWVLEQIKKKSDLYGAQATEWTLLVYVDFGWHEWVNWSLVKQRLIADARPFKLIDALSPDGCRVERLFTRRISD